MEFVINKKDKSMNLTIYCNTYRKIVNTSHNCSKKAVIHTITYPINESAAAKQKQHFNS